MAAEDGDPFAEAYRAYLVAIKKAWAEVDVDTLMANQSEKTYYDCAGSVSCLGSIATLGTATGATLGTLGTFGCVAVKSED